MKDLTLKEKVYMELGIIKEKYNSMVVNHQDKTRGIDELETKIFELSRQKAYLQSDLCNLNFEMKKVKKEIDSIDSLLGDK